MCLSPRPHQPLEGSDLGLGYELGLSVYCPVMPLPKSSLNPMLSHWGWSMPYWVTCTAKGPTARWSFWGWMLWRRATAHVWERPSLIHTASARDAAGFRQFVVMPVIVRLWVASDTLAGGGR